MKDNFEQVLPQGDWYIVPPVDGDWHIDATPDGRGGQHMRMHYPEGYTASVYMRSDGVLRVRLYRNNIPVMMELDEEHKHIWFTKG